MILFITLYENNVTSLEVINNFITFQGMYICYLLIHKILINIEWDYYRSTKKRADNLCLSWEIHI